MLGSVVNALAIMVGASLGLMLKGRLKERLRHTIMQGLALAVVIIGLYGAVGTFLNDDVSTLVFILSIAIGGLFGAALDIDHAFNRFALHVERKLTKGKDGLAKGFVTCSILYCVGAMSIVGSIESGVAGTHDILFAKSALDGISAVIFAATLGPGVILSAAPVFIYQGAMTLAAGLVAHHITDAMMTQISAIGGAMVFAIGLNLLGVTQIKLANFLPAVFAPVVYYAVIGLFA